MVRKILLIVFVVFVLGFFGFLLIDEEVPEGQPGPRAEFLADQMLDVLGYENWKNINAVSWQSALGNHYLWDKQSDLVQVKWGEYRAILDTKSRNGEVYENGKLIEDQEQMETAYSYFANDSFWLIAPFKIKDPGTVRKVVNYEGKHALLVEYTSGGVTPGDKYLWIFDKNGMPKKWKFWVSIVPIGGMEFTWDRWENLNGAKISTFHDGILDIEVSNLKIAESAESLNNNVDPFKTIR